MPPHARTIPQTFETLRYSDAASREPPDDPSRPTPSGTETAIGRRAFRVASFPERANARKAPGVCVVRAALIAAGIATSQAHPQPQYVVAQTPAAHNIPQ